MMRNAKLKIAAATTVVVATVGFAGATVGAEAGKPIKTQKDHSWCC
jgi:hypothetical protein